LGQSGGLETLYQGGEETAQAWVEWTNAHGGLNGHPVEVVVADTQSSPTAGQPAVKKLVEEDNVDAIMISDDGTLGAVADYLVDKNIAVFGANGSDPSVWGARPNFFTTTTLAPYTTTAEVIAAEAVGAKKIGAVVCGEVPACATVGEVLEPTATKLGLTYTGLSTASGSDANFTAACLSLMEKDTEVIILALLPSTASRVMTDCIQQGFDGYFAMSSNTVDMSFISKVKGVKVTGDVAGFPWWADAGPVAEFREAMTAYAPDTNYRSNSATGTWTALALFAKALSAQSGADVTRESILDAFNQIKDETLDGILPEPVTYVKGEPGPVVKAAWIFTYQDGDADPKTVVPATPCNGTSGDLASTCQD
jgi:branched-chain amino acid transport system substrate-binding protein